jgi:RHS repeat-associated protein
MKLCYGASNEAREHVRACLFEKYRGSPSSPQVRSSAVRIALVAAALVVAPSAVALGVAAAPPPRALAHEVGSGSGAGGDASSSNASNYQQGTQLSVNPRTGSVSMSAELVQIPGVVEDITLSLVLSYRSDDARDNSESDTRYFGLPYGWWLNTSFIDNVSTEQKLYLDGSQVYVIDPNWRTTFTPTGGSGEASVKTGMLQYNRADANFREDDPEQPTVTVGGIPSAYVFARLDGATRYFSASGLELQETDRYGNSIRYFYDRDTNPRDARFTSITDSWGNQVTFEYCDGSTCAAGEVIIILPDGRAVGWVAPDESTISYIIDAEGKRTHLSWDSSPCAHGNSVLSGMTSASGGMMALEYSCLEVCTQPSSQSCQNDGNATTWPVASRLFECPNNASGTPCPDGSPSSDFLTTTYAFGTAQDSRNYTGYPLYSPYQTISQFADSLMESNDTAYRYTTVTSKLSAGGTVIHQTETDYNFLHLQTEQRISVRARQSNGQFGLSLVKEKSYCYSVSSGGISCPLDAADYQNLPANYQSATIMGSCVYDVDDPGGRARRSVATMAYDSFGNVVNKREFHATGSEGIVSGCDRSTRLSTSGMRLVSDTYQQFDTPVGVSSDGFVSVGFGSGHFGLLTAMQSFLYLDEDESGVGAHGGLGATTDPVLVTLACHELTSDSGVERAGTQLKENTTGLMATDAEPPTTPGVITACAARSWDASVAPPKTTSFSYDAQGRTLSKTSSWAAGFEAPGGVSSTGVTTTYTLTGSDPSEEGCGQGSGSVLAIAWTDVLGDTSTNRVCTLNGFQVAHIDASGNRTLFEHLPTGLVSRTTHPNGSANTTDYYYACPIAQDGRSHTCASSVPQGCPADDQQPARSCMIETVLAGTDPTTGQPNTSFADGVKQVTIKDGLGRVVAMRDDLGAGTGYTELQTRSTTTFDSLGLPSERAQQIGGSDPLVYRTTVSYGPKLRPILTCGSHGDAHEFVHHDVDQEKLALFNGRARESYALSDSQKLATIANCALAAGETGAGTGVCPTVASNTDSTSCPADAYFTYILNDGGGEEHSLAASAGAAMDPGATVSSVSGQITYSADRLKYSYSYTGASDSQQVTATSTWERDLNGQPLKKVLTMQTGDGTTTASTDTYEFDELARKTAAHSNLDPSLVETDSYTPTGLIERNTDYEGVTFRHTYDSMDRLVRYCFPSEGGGSEGERFTLDPITGSVLKLQHFTNPGSCDDCNEGECEGDVLGESIQYSYTRFAKLASMTYDDGVGAELQWAYDPYQRATCFADAMATANGKSCPSSPTAVDFQPAPEDLLVSYRYWPDDDPYRRGRLKSMCRGVREPDGSYVTKCMDTDYYTPVDTGGACDTALSGVVGAYSGLTKQQAYCTGGSCLDGSGTLVYRTTYLYDAHRRPCSVETRNAAGSLIRGSTFTHDQYDQVLTETHASELDPSQDSNYQLLNTYDGMLRLVGQTRNDAQGSLIENVTYKYDAASNLVQKVQQIAQPPGSEHTPTPAQPTPTAPTSTPSSTFTPASTPSPTVAPPDNDDGCQIHPGGHRSCAFLFVAALLFALLSRRRIWERIGLLALAVLASTWAPSGGAQVLQTITTSYQYNGDGELTAVTTQIDGEEPSTTYLTWDDFVPNGADPTTGAVSGHNGRLVAYGPNPGTAGAVAQFQYDRRDRLTGYTGNGQSVGYAHHPTGLLQSATLDGTEAWRFYYEDSSNPQVTNIYEDASGLWSGYLDEARYLSDGDEEILLQPRKDVASVYRPQSEAVIPYRYDPYGAQDAAASTPGYDLTDNPFRYTRELRDPVWGGVYLRARWYDPDLPIFLSRDPMDGRVNHYGYAGGNPEMNVDPSGKSYKEFKRAVHYLDSGLRGHFTRIFLAPFLGPLEIAAHPKNFWHQLKYDKGGIDLFLAAGILAEAVGPIGSLADPELFQEFTIETRFSARLSIDVILGVGQTVAAAHSSGSGQFSWNTFGKGLESTFGATLDLRLVGGLGYRPFDMSGEDVANFAIKEKLDDGQALIFRRQTRLPGTFRQGGPIQEALHLGVYHEQIVAVTKDGYFTTEFLADKGVRAESQVLSYEARAEGYTGDDFLRLTFKEASGKFQFVGKTTNFDTLNGFSNVNLPGFVSENDPSLLNKLNPCNNATGYNLFTNNCQYHAYAVRQYLGVR